MAKNYFFPLKKSKILRKISRSGRSSSHLDLRNILSVRPHPPYEKNKLLLNEYLGDFMHFETIFFFLRKMTFSNPPTPLKCGKFRTFFFKPSLRHNIRTKKVKLLLTLYRPEVKPKLLALPPPPGLDR